MVDVVSEWSGESVCWRVPPIYDGTDRLVGLKDT